MVSRISDSTDTRPLSLGSNSWSSDVSVSTPSVSWSFTLFQPSAPKPDCHGREYWRPGSKEV